MKARQARRVKIQNDVFMIDNFNSIATGMYITRNKVIIYEPILLSSEDRLEFPDSLVNIILYSLEAVFLGDLLQSIFSLEWWNNLHFLQLVLGEVSEEIWSPLSYENHDLLLANGKKVQKFGKKLPWTEGVRVVTLFPLWGRAFLPTIKLSLSAFFYMSS